MLHNYIMKLWYHGSNLLFLFSNNLEEKDLNRKERAGQELAGNGYDSTSGLEPPTVWAIVPAV